MGTGHAHSHDAAPALHLGRRATALVLALVVSALVASAIGVASWWPDARRVDRVEGLIPFAAPGYSLVHAELLTVRTACTGTRSAACGDSSARVLDGRSAGRTVSVTLTPDVIRTGLAPRDRVLLFDGSRAATAEVRSAAGYHAFTFYRADRGPSMLLFALLFALAVVAVAGRRGMMALVSLAFAGLVVVAYLIPALLSGRPAVPVALAGAVLILVVMLYLTHGFSMRTSVALAGALVGIALSAGLAWLGIMSTHLAGLGDDAASLLASDVPWIDVQQLVVASVVLAGVGTLNDVTVTQASALWELRATAPDASRGELFRSAMRIGRDHVASTVYTLVFAYLGTALVLLVAVQLTAGGAVDFLTADDVAEEIVRALVGAVALVLAMPVTTAIGALVVAGAEPVWDEDADLAPVRRRRHGADPLRAAR